MAKRNGKEKDDPFRVNRHKDGTQTRFLPGMEPKKNGKVHAAGEEYADLRDKRMNAGMKEIEAKQELIDVMRKEGLTVYEYGDLRITLESKDKVKVKVIDPDKAQAEQEPEDAAVAD